MSGGYTPSGHMTAELTEQHMTNKHGWRAIGPTGERDRKRIILLHHNEHAHVPENKLSVPHSHGQRNAR